ncbi:MCE family protein [Actinosynnema sp. NPDC047251]|uniref:Putative Mce family protein n=1 Tax=Saccharothrix espanaensis (strain ATCC 51144 / DSM 44229 / JCM 9112 / NBRC 15066 / NRRL 15764) TaxID=1179773 RepID=K0KF92_SACES|nr:MCE family protein [Saccharothrix espanaensis]CCH35178.1 putative Mce family protein [Saccharothrix espanaensis DSM 44229]
MLRQRLLGVVFLAVIALFLTLTVALYNDAFTKVVKVTLKTDRIGNQLLVASDVKVRGMIVGEVKRIRTAGDGAELELAIRPDQVEFIPGTVSARLLPKTLFGERYVNLVVPREADLSDHLADGDVIEQDRSSSAIELERVLDDLMPVLQAVQPEKLATTLTAMSQALDNRGKPLGETLVQLDAYLGQLNPQLPQLKEGISRLADVSNVYADAAPDLVQALSDATVTSRTLVDQRDKLLAMYGSLTTTSIDVNSFLAVNRNNLIQLADVSRPTLELLAKYAPEYPCLLKGLSEFKPIMDQVFGKGTDEPGLHITLEITANRGKYEPGKDEPEYADKRGPRCYDIVPRPDPFPQYPPEGAVKDGSTSPPPARVAADGVLPPATGVNGMGTTSPSSLFQAPSLANSPEEQDFLAALLAPQFGVREQEMPSFTALLLGPLYRGAEVRV